MICGLRAGQNVGGSLIDTGFGTTADCAVFGQWILNSGCWGYSPSAWKQMGQFQAPPMPPHTPAVPLAYTGQGTYAGDAVAVIEQYWSELTDVEKQQAAASSDEIQAWAENQVPVGSGGGGGMGTWVWVLIGVGAVAVFLLPPGRSRR